MVSAAHTANTTILLVEDEPLIRRAAEHSLLSLGYRPIVAATGKDALAALAANFDIAVMVTDISMPGMDGRELAEKAQSAYPGLQIVLTTGLDLDNDDRTGLPILSKPYMPEELAAAIERALILSAGT